MTNEGIEAGTLPLALTMGEPAGIGGELALKAWVERSARAVPAFVLLDAVGHCPNLSAPDETIDAIRAFL